MGPHRLAQSGCKLLVTNLFDEFVCQRRFVTQSARCLLCVCSDCRTVLPIFEIAMMCKSKSLRCSILCAVTVRSRSWVISISADDVVSPIGCPQSGAPLQMRDKLSGETLTELVDFSYVEDPFWSHWIIKPGDDPNLHPMPTVTALRGGESRLRRADTITMTLSSVQFRVPGRIHYSLA